MGYHHKPRWLWLVPLKGHPWLQNKVKSGSEVFTREDGVRLELRTTSPGAHEDTRLQAEWEAGLWGLICEQGHCSQRETNEEDLPEAGTIYRAARELVLPTTVK